MLLWIYQHLLLLILLSPLLGTVLVLIIPRRYQEGASEISLFSTAATTTLSIFAVILSSMNNRFLFTETYPIKFGFVLRLAIDGLSAVFIPLIAFSFLCTVLFLWRKRSAFAKEGYSSLLLMNFGLIGLLLSSDILFMYLFMETFVIAGILVMVLLEEKKDIQRFLGFNATASFLLLIVLVFFYLLVGITDLQAIEKLVLAKDVQIWVFLCLLLSVLLRSGMVPFSSPAKEAGSLFTVFYSFSAFYFLFRLVPVFEHSLKVLEPFLPFILVLSIAVSSLIFLGADKGDMTGLFSVYFGFVLLGITSLDSQGFAGSGILFFGIIVCSLFLKAVQEVERIFGKNLITTFSYFVVFFALAGIPGIALFPGLFLIWMGLVKSGWAMALITLFSIVVVGARIVFIFAEIAKKNQKSEKPALSEGFILLPFIVMVFAVGIFPDVILKSIKHSTEAVWKLLG